MYKGAVWMKLYLCTWEIKFIQVPLHIIDIWEGESDWWKRHKTPKPKVVELILGYNVLNFQLLGIQASQSMFDIKGNSYVLSKKR